VADRRNGFVRIEKRFHESDSILVLPQVIRIHNTARQQQGIKIAFFGRRKIQVHRHRIAPIRAVPALNFTIFGRNYYRLCTGRFKRPFRLN